MRLTIHSGLPMQCLRHFVPVSLALSSLAATAQETSQPAAREPALPLWEIGAVGFGVSQLAYPGADQQLNRGLVLPYALYRGRVLRADRDSAGLRAIKTDRYELDLGVSASFGGGGKDIRAREGMRRLGTLVELGPRLKIRLGEGDRDSDGGGWQLQLPLRAVFDVDDDARHRGYAFEPQLVFERRVFGAWRTSSSLGLVWADRKLGDTFYGVSAAEATATRAAYTAKGGLMTVRLATSASYALNRDWRLFGFARLDSVQGAANEASPLVRRTNGASVGLGLTYTFARSQASAYE